MNGEFRNKKVVITGPRKLHPEDKSIVFATILDIAKDRPHSIIIGGAMGVDTAAFVAAAMAKRTTQDRNDFYLEVILPAHLGNAPMEFREALKKSNLLVDFSVHPAQESNAPRVLVLELGMDPSHPASYHTRNSVMLGRAGWSAADAVLVAFAGKGKARGGTFETIGTARDTGMRVIEHPVRVVG